MIQPPNQPAHFLVRHPTSLHRDVLAFLWDFSAPFEPDMVKFGENPRKEHGLQPAAMPGKRLGLATTEARVPERGAAAVARRCPAIQRWRPAGL